MYGLAGAKHTPGMPDMNRQIQRMTGVTTSSPLRKPSVDQHKGKTGKHTYESKSKKEGLKYENFQKADRDT